MASAPTQGQIDGFCLRLALRALSNITVLVCAGSHAPQVFDAGSAQEVTPLKPVRRTGVSLVVPGAGSAELPVAPPAWIDGLTVVLQEFGECRTLARCALQESESVHHALKDLKRVLMAFANDHPARPQGILISDLIRERWPSESWPRVWHGYGSKAAACAAGVRHEFFDPVNNPAHGLPATTEVCENKRDAHYDGAPRDELTSFLIGHSQIPPRRNSNPTPSRAALPDPTPAPTQND